MESVPGRADESYQHKMKPHNDHFWNDKAGKYQCKSFLPVKGQLPSPEIGEIGFSLLYWVLFSSNPRDFSNSSSPVGPFVIFWSPHSAFSVAFPVTGLPPLHD